MYERRRRGDPRPPWPDKHICCPFACWPAASLPRGCACRSGGHWRLSQAGAPFWRQPVRSPWRCLPPLLSRRLKQRLLHRSSLRPIARLGSRWRRLRRWLSLRRRERRRKCRSSSTLNSEAAEATAQGLGRTEAAAQGLGRTSAVCTTQEVPKGSDLERMLASGGTSTDPRDHASPLPGR